LTEINQQPTHLRDPRIESLRAELHGSSLVSGQSTPRTTGIATASVGTSAASPASDGHVTPAPIAVNIDDELDPLNSIDGSKTQTSAAHGQQEIPSAPAATVSASQPQNKAVEHGGRNEHSDDAGSEVESESDYGTDSEAEEPDCRVIVNVSLLFGRRNINKLICYEKLLMQFFLPISLKTLIVAFPIA
jgi:hypothetical protein